jgi:hypothetical protein
VVRHPRLILAGAVLLLTGCAASTPAWTEVAVLPDVAVVASAPPAPLGPLARLPVPVVLRAARGGSVLLAVEGVRGVAFADLPRGARVSSRPPADFRAVAGHLPPGPFVHLDLPSGGVVSVAALVPVPASGTVAVRIVAVERAAGGFRFTRRRVAVGLPPVAFPTAPPADVDVALRAMAYLLQVFSPERGFRPGPYAGPLTAAGLTAGDLTAASELVASAYRRLLDLEPGLFAADRPSAAASRAVGEVVAALDRALARRLGVKAPAFFAAVRKAAPEEGVGG